MCFVSLSVVYQSECGVSVWVWCVSLSVVCQSGCGVSV